MHFADLDGAGRSTRTVEFEFEGVLRTVLVSEPAQPGSEPVPLIVDLHASGLTAELHRRTTRLEEYCNAVVVRPQAVIPLQFRPGLEWGWAWNIPGVNLYGRGFAADEAPPADDIAFLSSIIRDEHGLWRTPVAGAHVTGFSGGARMACLLASETAMDSIAVVAGLRPPSRDGVGPVDVLAVHGSHDAVNPFGGGTEPRWDSSVLANARCWGGADGPPAHDRLTPPQGAGLRVHRFGRATLVEHLGGGHCWPGAIDPVHRDVFDVCDDLDASALIAEFLGCAVASAPTR
jgi:polyhydroxybutyrate depolymerase